MSARRTCQYPARAPFKRPLVAWGGGMLCVLLLASGCSQSSQQTSETKRNPEEVLRMLEARGITSQLLDFERCVAYVICGETASL